MNKKNCTLLAGGVERGGEQEEGKEAKPTWS